MEILNTKELANYLKVSSSTIRRLISRKEIPFYKISNKIFFNRNTINEWIDTQMKNNISEREIK